MKSERLLRLAEAIGDDSRVDWESESARDPELAPMIERLRGIGEWMRLHGRSIHGCGAGEFTPPPNCAYTQNGKRLYLHLLSWPLQHVHLHGLAGKVEYAQLLNDASDVRMVEIDPKVKAQNTTMAGTPGALTLVLPVVKPDVTIPVVELFLK